MSLIPSESYSFPDHFTRTVTYCRDPKQEKEEEKECVPLVEPEAPRKKSFFLPIRKSLAVRKKGAVPRTDIPEAPSEEDFLPLTAPPAPRENSLLAAVAKPQASQQKNSLPAMAKPQARSGESGVPVPPAAAVPPKRSVPVYVTPELMAERSIAPAAIPEVLWKNGALTPTINPEPPQQPLPPIARSAPPLRKSSASVTLKPKPRWEMRSMASERTTPAANDGGLQIDPVNGPNQKMTAANPTQPASLPRVHAPPPGVVQAPAPDLVQVLLSHAAQAPTHATETAAPAPNPSSRRTSRREIPSDPARPIAHAATTLNQEFNFEAPPSETPPSPERRRRSVKFVRFILCESVAIGILIPLAILGLCRVFRDPTLILLVNMLTITAAVTASLIPILFFALSPTLPRDESMNRL